MVAPFGDLQVGIVTGRQLDTVRGNQALERIVRGFGHISVHMFEHLLIGVRPGDLQHLGVDGADLIFLGAQAAGDDHLAILGQCLANCFQGFLYGTVDKAAGIDDDQFGIVITVDHIVPFGTQLGQNSLRVDQIFRATEGNKTYAWVGHDDSGFFNGIWLKKVQGSRSGG